tara:strand:- start:182 stop:649 length:468 start_codon:yes stop_codon:yes gene_type:complete
VEKSRAMDLTILRDRIRTNAKAVNLTYTEIETLADINDVLNQTMPCLLWEFEGESNDYENSSVSEVVLSLYFITNLHEEQKIESGLYERDYIITQRDLLKGLYTSWLKKLPSDELGIRVLRDNQVPIAERLSIEGFFMYEMRVTIEVLRNFCFDE